MNNFARGDNADEVSSSSTVEAIVHCEAGDSVWLEVVQYGGLLYDAPGLRFNHFSGILLRADTA